MKKIEKKIVKKMVEIEVEVDGELIDGDGEDLETLLNQYVQLWCVNYIYSGKLLGVNDHYVLLGEAGIVYETGPLNGKSFKDFQPVYSPDGKWRVERGAIESFGLAPKMIK